MRPSAEVRIKKGKKRRRKVRQIMTRGNADRIHEETQLYTRSQQYFSQIR